MWERIVRDSLPAVRHAVPPGSRVLEIGYGDGLLSCWMAAELGWHIVGLDVTAGAGDAARRNTVRFGLTDAVDFRVCEPKATRRHAGQYDAVFVKTVLYSSESITEYREWLEWIASVLRPGGILVNYETGRASGLVQAYRRFRRREYTGLCLYTGEIEQLYDTGFAILSRRYYGGLSQFLSPVPYVYEMAAALEETLSARTADNCFAVSLVGRARPLPLPLRSTPA
jgi:ubiquinone/menaquinone biosynthesis C-methylase UbiE